MRTRIWSSVFVLAGLLAAVPARADVPWGGPGWYVEGTETGFDTFLVSGPYSDQAACDSAKPADDDDAAYDCEYESSDPNDDTPP